MSANRRSPRWAFLEGFQIARNGRPYLDRLRIVGTPWFSLMLHRIHIPDPDRDPHNHPWWFASVVLSGGYTETVGDVDAVQRQEPPCETRQRVRGRFSVRSLERHQAHRITEVRGQLWTLVRPGPRRSSWGFWTEEGYVDWRDYLKSGSEDVALWGGAQ